MSKILYLFIVRHGHAEFDSPTDFVRPLNVKGIKAVKETAQFIKHKTAQHSFSSNLCLSSSAKRTLETSELISDELQNLTIQPYQELYATSLSTWLKLIESSSKKSLILVGHNPTFSQMVNCFCGKNVQMKPADCAFVRLELKPDGIIYPATLIDYHHNE